uniref:Uncharacterized protein n=1 Tax=Arundo donax TaxID=35708 RepID=A0A0A8XNV2_ARUDO
MLPHPLISSDNLKQQKISCLSNTSSSLVSMICVNFQTYVSFQQI